MLGVQRGPGHARMAEGASAAAVSGDRQRRTAEDVEQHLREVERDAWTILTAVHGLGPVSFAALLRRFGSGGAIIDAASSPGGARQLLRDGSGEPATLNADLAQRIVEAVQAGEGLLERVRAEGLTVITLDDPEYPARLLAVEMPPPALFVRGSIEALSMPHSIAVVGTRRPSDRGRQLTGRIAGAIARCGACVVSGLAVGIDGAAHAAVVAQRLPTVAVLGSGHAHLYPRVHTKLGEAIVEASGAVISELPPDSVATAGTFPRRNRLVSGLADATVVVEAAQRSGALITASWALEQGRECFLVPGPLDAPTSAGCLAFLRECHGQARIVAGVPELLEDLGLVDLPLAVGGPGVDDQVGGRGAGRRPAPAQAVLAELGEAERTVARSLLVSPMTADQLVAETGLPVAAVLGTLTLLEIRALVTSAYGRYRATGVLAT